MTERLVEPFTEWERYAATHAQLRGDLLSSEYEVFAREVDVAAEAGVRLLAEAYAASTDAFRRRSGKCYEVSIVVHEILREIGIETTFRGAGANRNGMPHSFLEAKVGNETLWIDGSWQQFLPPYARADRLPETLITPVGAMPYVLDRTSIDTDWRPIWVDSRPQTVTRRDHLSLPFQQLLDDRGWMQSDDSTE